MVKMSKAECSNAGKALAKNGTSAAGKKLAEGRWGNKKKQKPKAPARQSRRLSGQAPGQAPVRGAEPAKKPRKKGQKKKKKRSRQRIDPEDRPRG